MSNGDAVARSNGTASFRPPPFQLKGAEMDDPLPAIRQAKGNLNKIKLTVTNEITGTGTVSGYSHKNHRTDDQFQVPLYKMTLEGIDQNGAEQSM